MKSPEGNEPALDELDRRLQMIKEIKKWSFDISLAWELYTIPIINPP